METILRQEWGFDGLVISDWVGTYSTVEAMNAGLDLEIPAPIYFRGELLLKAIKEGKVTGEILNKRAGKLIELVLKTERMQNPDDREEFYDVNAERDEFIAASAAEGIVLLKNEGKLLPLKKSIKVAVIGQHAVKPPIMGGGSAVVSTDHVVSPIKALEAAGVDVKYEPGVPIYAAMPLPETKVLSRTGASQAQEAKPVRIEWFNGSVVGTDPAKDEMVANSTYMIKEKWPTWLTQDYCTRMTFDVTPETTGPHVFAVVSTGTSTLYVDGEKIYHREQEPVLQREAFYFFRTKLERMVTYNMNAGQLYTVTMESWATPQHIIKGSIGGEVVQGHAVGFLEHVDLEERISDAASTAKNSDVAIVFTGTTLEFETEGYDRSTMDLQPKEYELVDAVVGANPNTIVVNTSGSPVTMTQFIDKIPGLIQMFYPGQESGTAITRVLTGEVNPSGRLPVTWPRRVEDNPSHGNWPGEDDIIRYEEGVFVGYRHYEKKAIAPLFPFGFGLSYTKFEIPGLEIATPVMSRGSKMTISCSVKNAGDVTGKVVVQFYVRRVDESKFDRPVKELKAFEKPSLEAEASAVVKVELDKYAVSVYDETSWVAEAGKYEILAGFSSEDIRAKATFEVKETFTWSGL